MQTIPGESDTYPRRQVILWTVALTSSYFFIVALTVLITALVTHPWN